MATLQQSIDSLITAVNTLNRTMGAGGGAGGGTGGASGTGGAGGAGGTSANDRVYISNLKQKRKIQKDLNDDIKNYNSYLKESKSLQKEINYLEKELKKLIDQNSVANAGKIHALKEELKYLKTQKELIDDQLVRVNKLNKAWGKVKYSLDGIQFGFSKVKSWGLFEMQKAIKDSALSMGVLKSDAYDFSMGIKAIADQTIEFGMGIEQVAKLQAAYSDSLGRTVIMGKEAGIQMAAMAKSTGLGEEGAGEFAANMQDIGYGAERTAGFVEQTMNDARSMGLNSAKVVKNLTKNIKLLNKFNFKNGAKGLRQMALDMTKIGTTVDMAAPMAEKLFNVEGAVEMSAKLQVLGGAWSNLADPFKLMYMARNDMAGLTKEVTKAAASTAIFNNKTKEFDISALQMDTLRQVADATGVSVDELVKSAKNLRMLDKIKGEIKFDIDKNTKEFIANTASLNENGQGEVMVNLSDEHAKLIKDLTKEDYKILETRRKETESMKDRAKQARNFDDLLNNSMTYLKQQLLPIIEKLTQWLADNIDKLKPWVDKIVSKISGPEFLGKVETFLNGVASVAKSVGNFITEYPIATAAIAAGGLGLFELGKWTLNGVALGLGFNSVASSTTGGLAGIAKGIGGNIVKAIGFGLAGKVVGGLTDKYTDKGSGANMLGKASEYALYGAGIGAMFGGVGAPVGAALGALYGAYQSSQSGKEQQTQQEQQAIQSMPLHDGVINFNPKDKFMSIGDGAMIAGTNENGNMALAKAIMSSTVPGFAMADYLFSDKKSNVNPAVSSTSPTKIEFGEIKFAGSIELSNGKGMTVDLSEDLLKSPNFIRQITTLIHKATADAYSGKNTGIPKKL